MITAKLAKKNATKFNKNKISFPSTLDEVSDYIEEKSNRGKDWCDLSFQVGFDFNFIVKNLIKNKFNVVIHTEVNDLYQGHIAIFWDEPKGKLHNMKDTPSTSN